MKQYTSLPKELNDKSKNTLITYYNSSLKDNSSKFTNDDAIDKRRKEREYEVFRFVYKKRILKIIFLLKDVNY
jgi:hypothetical protein